MNILRILVLAVLAFITYACTTTGGDKSDSESTASLSEAMAVKAGLSDEQRAVFQSALKSARSEITKAEEVGNAWRDTDELLKKAEEAMQSGDFDNAMKLVSQANKQASDAYKQFESEQNAGPRYD